ncbi:hypothetical protein [Clostridium sp. ZBS13]|uniref:hypothetical protein n=1 Tax=Clostridium sp. ZBS13 TaxID=2949971 RepID=UPI0020792063|nr:hypothetical protein [Clostridium sp. ZBS13]
MWFYKNNYNGEFLENKELVVTVENDALSTIVGYVCKESFETGELVRGDYEKLK